jgi:hypothetical protein
LGPPDTTETGIAKTMIYVCCLGGISRQIFPVNMGEIFGEFNKFRVIGRLWKLDKLRDFSTIKLDKLFL